MKSPFAFIFSLLLFNNAFAESKVSYYKDCYICINGDPGDPTPKETLRECRFWLPSDNREDLYSQMIPLSKVSEKANSKVKCENVHVFGAFHAYEAYISYPFTIARFLTLAHKPKKLTYDGSSCLIFKNVDYLESMASSLLAFSNTKFEISGNQNEGYVWHLPPLIGWHEWKRQSSKVKVSINKGDISLRYQKCSRPKKSCINDSDIFSTSKYCQDKKNDSVEIQTCCPAQMSPLKSRFGTFSGVWSIPGKSCDQSFDLNFKR